MYIVTLSWDDGFRKSNLKVAEVYERRGLRACFNVIASAHLPGFVPPRASLKGLGDFGLWNELAARGHEIMPHGYEHENLTTMTFEEGKDLTLRCLDLFERELRGFHREAAVYNFPFNASTPEMEAWLPSVVRAFRTGYDAINPLPTRRTVRVMCGSFGPENCEEDIDNCLKRLLALPDGWLIYNTHGLDDEGWGPIRLTYLERLLDRLMALPAVRILPTARALP